MTVHRLALTAVVATALACAGDDGRLEAPVMLHDSATATYRLPVVEGARWEADLQQLLAGPGGNCTVYSAAGWERVAAFYAERYGVALNESEARLVPLGQLMPEVVAGTPDPVDAGDHLARNLRLGARGDLPALELTTPYVDPDDGALQRRVLIRLCAAEGPR